MEKKLSNKTGVVVGGSRGIGRAIALRMGTLGMNMAVLARKQEELDQLGEEIRALGVKYLPIICDASDFEGLGRAYQQVWDTFGRFDLLVNSAGTGVMTPFEDLTLEDIDSTIDVNLKGTIYSVRQAVGYMAKSGGGNILNISSMSAIRGIPDPVNCNGIYTSTKFAVNGFTECMQQYLLTPFNTTYWTNWPTVDNNYIQPTEWWYNCNIMIHNVHAAG